MSRNLLLNQALPIALAVIIFGILSVLYFTQISLLNLLPPQDILLQIRWPDVLVGLTIYLKTSIDFALLTGILISKFPGTQNRVTIEVGTAVGNALGTMSVLIIWFFFKEVTWLLALMILFASLVLFKLAQTSLEHVHEQLTDEQLGHQSAPTQPVNPAITRIVKFLNAGLSPINRVLAPVLSRIMPDLEFKADNVKGLGGLFLASFTIPFILGMDDFAGYVPLFNVVNVFGFGIGVFLGHMILNVLLFLNPGLTIRAIKNPIIAIIGSVAFIALAIWGLSETGHLIYVTYLVQH